MNPNIVSALLAGGFLLLGTAVGSLLTNWSKGRALVEQRAYEEALRRRELALAEQEKFHPVSDADARVVGKMLNSGGQFLRSELHWDRALGDFSSRAGCVPRGTMVMMDDGSFRPIEILHKGSSIRIYRAHIHAEADRAISDIRIDAGKRLVIINKEIAMTPEQDVLSDGIYQPAGGLRLGATLASDSRRGVEVTSVEVTTIDEDVYSIALDEDAGYFIRSPQAEHAVLIREATTGKQSLTMKPEVVDRSSD